MTYDLNTLKALYAKATPGEWRIRLQFTNAEYIDQAKDGDDGNAWVAQVEDIPQADCFPERPRNKANAAWIVTSHNAFPALVREVEAARALREALKDDTPCLCYDPHEDEGDDMYATPKCRRCTALAAYDAATRGEPTP
jgi:hypothetical protein